MAKIEKSELAGKVEKLARSEKNNKNEKTVRARRSKSDKTEKTEKNAKTETKRTRSEKPEKTERQSRQTRGASGEKLKIISLGGLNEIGKNLTVIEYGQDILMVDCGMAFPDDEMPGIDLVIPDTTYLSKNRDRIKGLLITHGHEDHIGAIPYVLRDFNVPIYGTRMAMGLLRRKLEEHRLDKKADIHFIKPHDKFKLGCFGIEAVRVNHSIADALAYAIKTPVGTIVMTGDFKIDMTPIQGDPIDLARFGELGKQGVLALLMDSTNAERPGYTMSERTVGKTFDSIFAGTKKRIIVATFASNVDRVQQIINSAVKFGRKVAVSGRSMVNMVEVASELGYISVPKGTIVDLDNIDRYPPERVVIITTGSQGEPMSALYRMAYSDHRKVEIGPGDLVVISASPIPGNEKGINNVINELYKHGVEIIHDSLRDVHVSGHACAEELKTILSLTRPKFFIPLHGEYRHLFHNKMLAEGMGIPSSNIILSDIGKVIELDEKSCRINGTVPAGRVLVDGLGVGDVGNIVLRDRKHLAQDGLIVVVVTLDKGSGFVLSGPDIVSRGFVYVREAEDLMEKVRLEAKRTLERCEENSVTDWGAIKTKLKQSISDLLFEKTKRKPMILPIIMEI